MERCPEMRGMSLPACFLVTAGRELVIVPEVSGWEQQ